MKRNGAFQSILFPTDFSEASATTAPYVREVAISTGARVSLLHVVPWLAAWYGQAEIHPALAGDALLQQVEQDAERQLQAFRQRYFLDLPALFEVRCGAVAETISETARDWGCDLIMMPTRGLGRTRPFLIGSTTAKVLHDAECAVWTSPHLSKTLAHPRCTSIICSLDRDDIPAGYVEEVLRLAACFNSKVSFVTAIPSCIGGFGDEHHVRSVQEEFPHIAAECPAVSDCNVVFETGAVGDVIRKAVETHSADLVILNRGHLKHAFGRFRTHTYEIVLESPCPVLSLCIQSARDGGDWRSVQRDAIATAKS